MSLPRPTAHRPALLACALLGLTGAALGAYLTVLKFRISYTPCLGRQGGCQIGELRCDDALGAAWSVVGGLPISAWASAAYLCAAVLAVGQLVRRDLFGGCAALFLWLLAGVTAVVSLAYAGYAALILRSLCPFCLSLYAVALVFLVCAEIVRRTAPPSQQHRLAVAVRHPLALIDAAFRVCMLMTIVTGAQSVAYHGLSRSVSAQAGCPEESLTPVPPATIRFGAAQPQVILAVYLDMSCSACKRKFRQLATALRNHDFPAPVQLWIYHAPRQACDPAAFPAGYAPSDDRARDDNACLAARAVECAERLQTGAGFLLIGGLFALHDDRQGDQPLFTARRIGDRAVDLGIKIDPEDPDNPLFRCIDDDREVLAAITGHQRQVEELGLTVPTIAVHAARDRGIDPRRPPDWAFANTPFDVLTAYVEHQAAPAPAP